MKNLRDFLASLALAIMIIGMLTASLYSPEMLAKIKGDALIHQSIRELTAEIRRANYATLPSEFIGFGSSITTGGYYENARRIK